MSVNTCQFSKFLTTGSHEPTQAHFWMDQRERKALKAGFLDTNNRLTNMEYNDIIFKFPVLDMSVDIG